MLHKKYESAIYARKNKSINLVFKKLIIILWSTALADLSTVARMQELLDPKAKHPLERNILFLKMLDYSTYIFLSALVGVETIQFLTWKVTKTK